MLADWNAPVDGYAWGAVRRDGDRDGRYDDGAAVAIMDAWWTPLIHAIYDGPLGQPVDEVSRQAFHNAPGSVGSAFQGGFYGQVRTDLLMVLGRDLGSPTSQVYCGSDGIGADGTLAACAERLWDSLEAVGATLADEQGSDDPTTWTFDATSERITFIGAAESMHWVNRPTTQVLASFGEPLTGPEPAPEGEPEEPSLPTTGGGAAAVALGVLAAGLAVRRRQVSDCSVASGL